MSGSLLAFFDDWSGDPGDPPRETLPVGCFVAFWAELGDLLIIDLLDSLTVCMLAASSAELKPYVNVPRETWWIPMEVTQSFRSSALIHARMACAGTRRCATPCADVVLPDVDILRVVPRTLASKGDQCRTLTLDFSAPVAFIDRCNYQDNERLSGDTWQSVVLKLRLTPGSLDTTLDTASKLCPNIEVLNVWEVPPVSIIKKVRQEVTSAQCEPLIFPAIEKFARFDKLRVLVFESRCHPNFVSTLSPRAFQRLVCEILSELPLEELSMRTLLLEEERRGNDTTPPSRTGMPLRSFLFRGLKRLRLAAIADWNSDETITPQAWAALDINGRIALSERSKVVEPFLINLSSAPDLQDLDLHFISSGRGVSALGGMFEDVQALAPKLCRFRISGLPGNDCQYLRPLLARRLALCKNLKVLELVDGVVQEDFLRELYACFATRSGTCLRGLELRIPFVTYDLSPTAKRASVTGQLAKDLAAQSVLPTDGIEIPLEQVLENLATLVERNGGCFHKGEFEMESPDLRAAYSDNKIGSADNRRVTQGLASYGQGMDWWVKGVRPMHMRQQINRIYGQSIGLMGNFGVCASASAGGGASARCG